MKKIIVATAVFAVILAGSLALSTSSPGYPDAVSSVPNLIINDTTYYFSTLRSGSAPPDGSVLLGIVNDAAVCTNCDTIITHVIDVGSEIYQDADYPGRIFTLKEGTLRCFTVWELACPMIRYKNDIYISVDYFMNCGDAKGLGTLNPSHFTEIFEPVGRLFFGECDTVPSQNFETNLELYNNSQLYSAENNDSTVYIELYDADGFIWQEAFYNASKIPLDYSVYIEAKHN